MSTKEPQSSESNTVHFKGGETIITVNEVGETSGGVDNVINDHEKDQHQRVPVLKSGWKQVIAAYLKKMFNSYEANDDQSFVINIPENDPYPKTVVKVKPVSNENLAIPPEHFEDMFITSGSNDQNIPQSEKDVINERAEMKGTSSSLEEKFKSLDDVLVVRKSQPKIQRVPSICRDQHKNYYYQCYRPRMVVLGPLGGSYYRSGNIVEDKEKLKLAALFIKENGLCKDYLFSKIKEEIKDLRNCYKEYYNVKSYNDDELSWIFLVDGCAILCYIHCARHEDTSRFIELKIKVDYLTFMQQDLFLLENQLPYRVLELLMSCMNDESEMRESIEKFIFDIIKAPGEEYKPSKYRPPNDNPIHLLDLLRTRLLECIAEDQAPSSRAQEVIKNVVGFASESFEKIHTLIEWIGKGLENSSCKQTQNLHFFRSIGDLKAAGIRLRPSYTARLTDITFNLGTLKLPPIVVDDSTASKFANLIAYEMCPDFINDFGVSSYIVFLDSLIDRPRDVKALRDSQILHNVLGSDEEVAELFNEIGANVLANPRAYSDVKTNIQKRYNNKWMTWIAQFNHQHFQSPWTVFAFLAAIVVLASTITQTVLAVLSYYE